MGVKQTSVAQTGPWWIARWAVIAALLLAPLIAMRFTDEVAWTPFDFAVAATLLVGAGLVYELVVLRLHDVRRRAVATALLAGAVLVLWAQGAVGIV